MFHNSSVHQFCCLFLVIGGVLSLSWCHNKVADNHIYLENISVHVYITKLGKMAMSTIQGWFKVHAKKSIMAQTPAPWHHNDVIKKKIVWRCPLSMTQLRTV